MGNIDLCNLCKHTNMKAIQCLITTHVGFSTPSQLTGGCAQEATRVNWEFAPIVWKCPLGWPCCTCILKLGRCFNVSCCKLLLTCYGELLYHQTLAPISEISNSHAHTSM